MPSDIDRLAGGEAPGRVLIVEDREPIRRALGDLLMDRGFEVRVAADGVQGVEAAGQWNPDVVVMDLRMPGWDGLEATVRIKANDPLCQVIVFSASEDPPTRKLADDDGVFCFLLKSSPAEQIEAAIERAIVFRRSLQAIGEVSP